MPFDGLESPFNYLAKLDEVIDLIEAPSRWTQGAYKTPGGQYCLKEALNSAGVAEIFDRAILRTAAERAEREFCCLESFNDSPDTTHSDVVMVLRRVREDVVAGRIDLPAPTTAKLIFGSDARNGKTAVAWFIGFWRRLAR
jgi:hypothetical protein